MKMDGANKTLPNFGTASLYEKMTCRTFIGRKRSSERITKNVKIPEQQGALMI